MHCLLQACCSCCTCCSCLKKGGVLQGKFDIPLFDRKTEQESLLEQLTDRPETILLILGPRSCGKTRLLQEFLLGLDAPVSWMSGRSQQFSDARTMSQVLAAELKVQQDALSMLKQGISYRAQMAQRFARTLSGSKVTVGNVELQLPPQGAASINDLIGQYKDVIIEQRDISGSWPVICIDEANVLTEWVTGGPALDRDLTSLLRFFVQVSCQAPVYCTASTVFCVMCADQGSCQLRASTLLQITKEETPKAHVILATSDYSFLTWLQASEPFASFLLQPLPSSSSCLLLHAELQVNFFRCEVIGDFPETEARDFLQHVMGKPRDDWEPMPPDEDWLSLPESTPKWIVGAPVADQEWARIYEVHPC